MTYGDAIAALVAKLMTGARGAITPEDVAGVVTDALDALRAELEIGVNVQAYSATLAAWAGIAPGIAAWNACNTLGGDIASAATINLDAATGNQVDVTGTTTITAITLAAGKRRWVRFTGALTLTNGGSLVLPSGANITTAVGDYALFVGYAAGVVRCTNYQRASGAPLVSSSGVALGDSPTWTGSHTFNLTVNLSSTALLAWGTTSSAPAFKASGAKIRARLADDSANADFDAKTLTLDGQATVAPQTLTDGASIAWNVANGAKAKVTLAGNRTMSAVTNAVEGTSYTLTVIQDATGSRTLSWTTSGSGSFDFGTDGPPTLTTTASKADLLCFEAVTIGGTLKLRFCGLKKGFS